MDGRCWLKVDCMILFKFWCVAQLAVYVAGQGEATDGVPQAKKLEETVVADMLKIVDNKFDTLTTRITALERAVSNLQFYSIRQFRQINGRLQNSENGLEAVSKQVGQLEVDGRGTKISLSLLSRDMTEIKSSTSTILGELESSVAYLNDNMDKQINYVKTFVDETFVKLTHESQQTISKQFENLTEHNLKDIEPRNCTIDMVGLTQLIDTKIEDYKMSTQSLIESKLKQVLKEEVPQLVEALSINVEKPNHSDKKSKHLKPTPNENNCHNTSNEIHDMDEQVLAALNNMTNSVLQAVSYLRNTGQLLEQTVSNTDILVNTQSEFTKKFQLVNLAKPSQLDELDVPNTIPGSVTNDGYHYNPQSAWQPPPKDMIWKFAHILQNGSQLLEVLTDLAQLSSVTMAQAMNALHDELKQIEGIKTSLASTYLAKTSGDESIVRIINTTDKIVKLVESVATNTGWLPAIVNNLQNMETLTNRSLYMVNRNYNVLVQTQQSLNKSRRTDAADLEATATTRAPQAYQHASKTTNSISSKEDKGLDKESLETIYSTSLQLNRIMPALTKLLSEPDPLITLVGGGRADQGRVEIYFKGHWGILCHNNLTHSEADAICSHLGFRGGISAGAGYFGAGTGVAWTFNASCLASSQCDVVKYTASTAHCNHEKAAAVICDHMLRIISLEGSKNHKIGRLEIHHRGMWLPICSEGWSGLSAQVACKQMGFLDGRETELAKWEDGIHSAWLSQVSCEGNETRLDACDTEGWMSSCPQLSPAGVRCL